MAMASSLALKRLVSSNLLISRFFSSNAVAVPVHDLAGFSDAHRRGRDDANGLRLQMDMPGLGEEDVNVSVEHNTLTIEGRGVNEFAGRRYSARVDLPADKLYDVGAEVKNGVLIVTAAEKEKEKEKEKGAFDDPVLWKEELRKRVEEEEKEKGFNDLVLGTEAWWKWVNEEDENLCDLRERAEEARNKSYLIYN